MISLYGSPGSLFNTWGKCGLLIKQLMAYQASQKTNLIDPTNGLYGQLNAEPDVQAIVGDSYVAALSGSESSFPSIAKQTAAAYANRLVFRDNPQLNQTLTSANTLTSLNEIIRQMSAQGATVLAMVVAATPTQFPSINTNVGNGTLAVSVRRPSDGRVLENAFAETLKVICTADSFVGGTRVGQEKFRLTGAGAQSDLFAFNWPLGSNCSAPLTAAYGEASASQGNLLTNGGFNNFTNNFPNNWSNLGGTAGTHYFKEVGNVFVPNGPALRVQGDGATTLTVQQTFGNGAAGTAATLAPFAQYAFNVWLRRDGGAPIGTGTLTATLVDGNGNAVADAGGNSQSLTVNLNSQLSTSYAPFSFAFRTPEVVTGSPALRLAFAPFSAGRSVYLDCAAVTGMTQAYTGGPYAAVFSGAVPFEQGDYATCAVTNGRGAAGTLSTFQTLLARLFGGLVFNNEMLFPSSALPSVQDSLIG